MKKLFSLAICVMTLLFAGCDSATDKKKSGNNDNPNSNYRAKAFSVSSSKRVIFSPGNLQYHPANNVWRFAVNQTDYVGNANANISSTYNGWLDLFGWSSVPTNFGLSTSTNENDYSGSFDDWGTNKIGNDAPNTWRTLTKDEWEYLLYKRNNASSLHGVAQVNGVNGMIFLPDSWSSPEGVTFKSGFHTSDGATLEHIAEYYAVYQTFTADQWSKLEAAGAVFLPAAGVRFGPDMYYVQGFGYYWSSTEYAHYLTLCPLTAYMEGRGRANVISVRLVRDLQ